MGTKDNPAAFDCYGNAEPDEPMFILLARDITAPEIVEQWAIPQNEPDLGRPEAGERPGDGLRGP